MEDNRTIVLTGWSRQRCITWLGEYGPDIRGGVDHLPLLHLKRLIASLHSDAHVLIDSLRIRAYDAEDDEQSVACPYCGEDIHPALPVCSPACYEAGREYYENNERGELEEGAMCNCGANSHNRVIDKAVSGLGKDQQNTDTQHTPGPWLFDSSLTLDEQVEDGIVRNGSDWLCIESYETGGVVAYTHENNARLIEATPKLYQIVRTLSLCWGYGLTKESVDDATKLVHQIEGDNT